LAAPLTAGDKVDWAFVDEVIALDKVFQSGNKLDAWSIIKNLEPSALVGDYVATDIVDYQCVTVI
jgi:hypothetical protein